MPEADFDLIIIGGGPAGLTAGMYAARAKLNAVLYEKITPGGQVLITDWIENYPGFPEGISGAELIQKMNEQSEKFGLRVESEEVLSMDFSGPLKTIQLSGKKVTASAVIIASGASPKRLGIPGEERFIGRGISFCATCDAPFFRDRVVAAVGGGDTAVQESIFLSRFVDKVYLIHRRDRLRATKILQDRAYENDKIEFVWDSVPVSIDGGDEVERVTLRNVKTDELRTLPVEGCFIWIGIKPNAEYIGDAVLLDEYGFVLTDANMETSVPGVFAAGDIRSTPLRQIATAVGDAATAAASAEHYIETLKM